MVLNVANGSGRECMIVRGCAGLRCNDFNETEFGMHHESYCMIFNGVVDP